MKKIIILSTCLSLVLSVSFAQKQAAPKPKNSKTEDTIQYSLGVYMMQQLFAKTGFTITDPAMFEKAINDVITKKPLMVSAAATESRLLAYQKVYQEQKGIQLEKMLFEKVKKEPSFSPLGGGVYYMQVQTGKGIRPSLRDTVILNVVCTLPDGTIIDDTNKSKQSYMAIAGEMIPGLREVLSRMTEGSVCRAIVPASMAYGQPGTTTVPPNSALIYDVALVSVKIAR